MTSDCREGCTAVYICVLTKCHSSQQVKKGRKEINELKRDTEANAVD